MAVSDRALRWEALLNARDLGGIRAAHGVIAHGAVVRSDALYRLNDAGRAALIEYGVRTVIDMRAPSEVTLKAYAFDPTTGVTRLHIAQQSEAMWDALRGTDRVTFDTAMLELAHFRLTRIARAISDAPEGGVLIHCEVGKDRTGLMSMLLLDLVGVPANVIAADYALTASGLAALFEQLIASAESEERRARLREEALCRAEVMLAIHRIFRERYGDAEAYLLAGGASRAEIDGLRARLLRPSRKT